MKNRPMNDIERLRRKKGLTQVEFAEIMEVSQGTISKIESGVLVPTYEFMRDLQHHFKVNLNKFFKNNGLLMKYYESE